MPQLLTGRSESVARSQRPAWGSGRLAKLLACVITALLLSWGGCHSTATDSGSRLQNAAAPLVTPTYDGAGQAMHPGIVHFTSPWHGYQYWMSMTPLTNGSAYTENPSILASNDGLTWVVPAGLTNPVVCRTNATLADPDLFYDAASDQLWLYYQDKNFPGSLHIMRKTSSDGVTWSAAEDLFGLPPYQDLSPAVEKLGDTYYLWCVNAGTAGYDTLSSTVEYHTSADGKNWSSAQTANISQPGYVIWHIDVLHVPSKNENWMVLAAFPVGKNNGSTTLFFATSPDGVTWETFSKPALTPSPIGWDSGEIYRSTLLYDDSDDMLRVWYSARGGQQWHTGYTQQKYADFLNYLQH